MHHSLTFLHFASNFIFYRWYAKRFLHPDIVSAYEYILIWDEDLGVEHFNGDKYDFHVLVCLKCTLYAIFSLINVLYSTL